MRSVHNHFFFFSSLREFVPRTRLTWSLFWFIYQRNGLNIPSGYLFASYFKLYEGYNTSTGKAERMVKTWISICWCKSAVVLSTSWLCDEKIASFPFLFGQLHVLNQLYRLSSVMWSVCIWPYYQIRTRFCLLNQEFLFLFNLVVIMGNSVLCLLYDLFFFL